MERPPFAFFAHIEPIEQSSDLFEMFKKEKFYFYYFQSNKLYYLFFYGKHHLSDSFKSLLSSLVIIQELDTKKRKLRSIRGFLLYALEIIQDEKQITVLKTNLQPYFWRKAENVIKQNKKNYLIEFLFDVPKSTPLPSPEEFRPPVEEMEIKENEIVSLREQIGLLQLLTRNQSTLLRKLEKTIRKYEIRLMNLYEIGKEEILI